MKSLNLPESLLDRENTVKMLTILFPCSTRKPLGDEEFRDVRHFFAEVFRENNVAIRNKFYSDPLIKHMWEHIFLVECESMCINHLRRIRSQEEQGEDKYKRFLSDIGQIELALRLKMLPDAARKEENTKVFSKEEELEDLMENGKYNKKQMRAVQEDIARRKEEQ